MRTHVLIHGTYGGVDGALHYIIEPDGVTVNHRLFETYQKRAKDGIYEGREEEGS